MAFWQIVLVILLFAGLWFAVQQARGFAAYRFLLEVYDTVLSFEWKPSEEIGKRINESKSDGIRSFVDWLYVQEKADKKFESRESFCKHIAHQIIPTLSELEFADVQSVYSTKEWCEENAFLLRELTQSEIDWHITKSMGLGVKHSPSDNLPEDLRLALLDIDQQVAELGLFNMVLARKKPGGKRPPRWSAKASKVLGRIQGAKA